MDFNFRIFETKDLIGLAIVGALINTIVALCVQWWPVNFVVGSIISLIVAGYANYTFFWLMHTLIGLSLNNQLGSIKKMN